MLYNNIGSVLDSQGNLEGALVEYQKSLEIRKRVAPDSLDVAASYHNIGEVLKSQGDLEGALEYFGKADSILKSSQLNLVSLHPSKLFCLYSMGETYLALNLPNRALEYADRVLNVAPDYKWAYVMRGKALLAIGNCEDAVACFDEAISRSPNFGDAHAGKVEAELALAKQFEHDKKLDDAQMERVADTVASALCADPASTDSVDENIRQTLKRAASVGRGQGLQEVLDAADSTALQVPKDSIKDRDDMRAKLQYLSAKAAQIEKLVSILAQHSIRIDEHDDAKKQVEMSVRKIGGNDVKLPAMKLDDRGSSWTQDDETDSPLPVKNENIGEDGKGWNLSSDEEHDAPIESVGGDSQLPVKKENIGEGGEGYNSSSDEEHNAATESIGGDSQLPVKKENIDVGDEGLNSLSDEEHDDPIESIGGESQLPVKRENIDEGGEGWNSSSDEEHNAPIESVGGDLQLPVNKENRGEDGEGWNSSSDEEHDAPIESVGGDSQLPVKKENRGEDGDGWNSSSDEEHNAPIESIGGDSQLPVKKEDIGEGGEGYNSSSDEENDTRKSK
jgi:tetratricopeptide (TPR) repeat protein